jgi:hypothetical protein
VQYNEDDLTPNYHKNDRDLATIIGALHAEKARRDGTLEELAVYGLKAKTGFEDEPALDLAIRCAAQDAAKSLAAAYA